MPEGPEVRVTTDSLRKRMVDRLLCGATAASGRYVTHGPPKGWDVLHKRLPMSITQVGCKGKFIYILLEDGSSVWNTLGMTGRWALRRSEHTRVTFILRDDEDDENGTLLHFEDARNFGTLRFVTTHDRLDKRLALLGPDPLEENVNKYVFKKLLKETRNVKRTLAEVLMDQRVLSGVGNYIKSESLYQALLSPFRTCGSLDDDDAYRLHKAVMDVMQTSYKAQGMTFKDFRNVDGEKGMFRCVVYGRKHDIMKNEVVSVETPDGRTTWWVPSVQK